MNKKINWLIRSLPMFILLLAVSSFVGIVTLYINKDIWFALQMGLLTFGIILVFMGFIGFWVGLYLFLKGLLEKMGER